MHHRSECAENLAPSPRQGRGPSVRPCLPRRGRRSLDTACSGPAVGNERPTRHCMSCHRRRREIGVRSRAVPCWMRKWQDPPHPSLGHPGFARGCTVSPDSHVIVPSHHQECWNASPWPTESQAHNDRARHATCGTLNSAAATSGSPMWVRGSEQACTGQAPVSQTWPAPKTHMPLVWKANTGENCLAGEGGGAPCAWNPDYVNGCS